MSGGGRILNWGIMVVIFALCLSISAAPHFFKTIAPLQHLPLICLCIAVILTAGDFPLWLLFIFGLMIDSIQGGTLGSSSLLLVLILPYIQLLSRSAVRFSLPRSWLLFISFLLLYQGGQILIQYILSEGTLPSRRLVFDSVAAILLFPILFAIVLYIGNRFRRNMMTPL